MPLIRVPPTRWQSFKRYEVGPLLALLGLASPVVFAVGVWVGWAVF